MVSEKKDLSGISLRKRPVQQRSKITIGALQEAFVRVLIDRGYEKMTIREVTAVAGVGIGSFYDYAPNLRALAASVRQICYFKHSSRKGLGDPRSGPHCCCWRGKCLQLPHSKGFMKRLLVFGLRPYACHQPRCPAPKSSPRREWPTPSAMVGIRMICCFIWTTP